MGFIDFSYAPIFLLAIIGALVANSTGAGGGIVFVPAFKLLGVDQESIIATSFAIQCFGMTAGSIAWWRFSKQPHHSQHVSWSSYGATIRVFIVPSVLGVLSGQTLFNLESVEEVIQTFKFFSFLFGLAILLTTYYIVRFQLSDIHSIKLQAGYRILAYVVGYVGGIITAWLSVGVGEMVAVLLILLRYPVRMAVGVAVTISAVSVWVGVQKYIWLDPAIEYRILVFAAPAAIIGGTLAKEIAKWLSPVQLKVFIAVWVLISSVLM